MPDTIDQKTLLSMLMNSQGGAQSDLDLQSLLTSVGAGGEAGGSLSGDQTQLIMRWLEERRAATEASDVEEAPPSEAELELLRLEEQREARQKRAEMRELNRMIEEVCAERDALVERNDTLAAALGACHLCFGEGEDLTCPHCGGQGKPGWRLPDPIAFREYIAPAVNRVRALQSRRQRGKPPQSGTPRHPPA